MAQKISDDLQLNQVEEEESSSHSDLRSTSGNPQFQAAGNAPGSRLRTTDDLSSRSIQHAAPQGPQPSRPTDLSQCTLEHVGRLTEQQKLELVYEAFEDGTLFDKLSQIRSGENGQEILKSLAEACKNISDDWMNSSSSDAKKCCMLLLAWAEANAFNDPAPSFDAFIREQKGDIVFNFGLLSEKQRDMLERLENAPGALDESTLNGKIFKSVIDNLAKPDRISNCSKWNIDKLNSSEALRLLQRAGIATNLATLTRNDATNGTNTKGQLLARLSPEDSKTLADGLLSSNSGLLITLIDERALPNLAHRNEIKLLATIHLAFERGITRGFFGERDSVDANAWEVINNARENLSLKNAREVWQNISNEMARYCFDQQGNIDTHKVRVLMFFLEQDSFFTQPPFSLIPEVTHMRSQMHEICERLLLNPSPARSELNKVKDISSFGHQGASVIQAMSMGRMPLLSSSEAILASLFTPHRQLSMPTCTINSLINEEIFNHPERLVQMYMRLLSGGEYAFPSGHVVQPKPITGSYITVDLKHGWTGRNAIFKDIKSGDPAKIGAQINRWQEEGILYELSSDSHTNYKLQLPMHNLNDLLFADLLEAADFGTKMGILSIAKVETNYNTALVYAGRNGYFGVYKKWISVSDTNFQDTISELKRHANRQREAGNTYMRVSTHWTNATSVGGHDHSYHSENIRIEQLLALDLDHMLLGQPYPIGDRNWTGEVAEENIPYLAVRKIDTTPPTYEFGTLGGSDFEKVHLKQIWIYKQSIIE
ncbi:MAG: hypothetical protein LBF42_01270 [Puniceicoccales bacterium]|jgi:hypothetical protein|nr:hypothetical protein [Puniceicoccales bacterium]